jgi:hypothetical protein
MVAFGATATPVVIFQAASALGIGATDKFLFQFASIQLAGDASPGSALSYSTALGNTWGMTSMLLMCANPADGSINCRRVFISSGTPPLGSDVLFTNHIT